MGKDSQRVGKTGEYRVIGELMKRNLTIYIPLFDVEGIDCVAKNGKGAHIDMQIKTRTKTKLWDVGGLIPRKNYFIVAGVIDPVEDVWVIPSTIFKRLSTTIKYKDRVISRLILSKAKEKQIYEYKWTYGFDALVKLT